MDKELFLWRAFKYSNVWTSEIGQGCVHALNLSWQKVAGLTFRACNFCISGGAYLEKIHYYYYGIVTLFLSAVQPVEDEFRTFSVKCGKCPIRRIFEFPKH